MTNFFTKLKNNKSNENENEDFFPINEKTENQVQNELIPKQQDEDWLDKEEAEGQLSVDVFQTKEAVIIKSTIAGVKPEDIDIAIDNDVITIRGERKLEESVKEDDYFYQECYWGSFSRSVVLPVEIQSDQVDASLKNGVLTVVLPKTKKNKSVAVKVKSE
ncbi:Hsp20/alpha crystallin family protein [Candidatus Parcubacteria bacterium]|nr:Hsp20/alpha crystallin family protein [Patescibacteria group bacterium]MBU4481857.1 Hsp20/alpha crystallin family protein [Patescibacteria group bacterium]MCG2686572.1 Hsp20/alpha crystallin family protein [Candidatus Parcubacteria bacterium]